MFNIPWTNQDDMNEYINKKTRNSFLINRAGKMAEKEESKAERVDVRFYENNIKMVLSKSNNEELKEHLDNPNVLQNSYVDDVNLVADMDSSIVDPKNNTQLIIEAEQNVSKLRNRFTVPDADPEDKEDSIQQSLIKLKNARQMKELKIRRMTRR